MTGTIKNIIDTYEIAELETNGILTFYTVYTTNLKYYYQFFNHENNLLQVHTLNRNLFRAIPLN